MTKRKRDPLAAVRRKHPGPWRVRRSRFDRRIWIILDVNGCHVAECFSHTLARAIAKLGNKK